MAGKKRDWSRKRTTTVAAARKGRGSWSHGMRVIFSMAWRRLRQRRYHPEDASAAHGLLFLILDGLRYYVLWVVEAVVVVTTLCFFYLRFGFRL